MIKAQYSETKELQTRNEYLEIFISYLLTTFNLENR